MDLKGEAGRVNTSYGPITGFLEGGKWEIKQQN